MYFYIGVFNTLEGVQVLISLCRRSPTENVKDHTYNFTEDISLLSGRKFQSVMFFGKKLFISKCLIHVNLRAGAVFSRF
jgi:hypothetical protein